VLVSSCFLLLFLSVLLLKLQSIKQLHMVTVENLFKVLVLLMKLLLEPDFLLDQMLSRISSLAVDFGALIDDAVKNLGFCFRKVLDGTSFFNDDSKLLLQKRWQTTLAVSAADVAGLWSWP
jgi:hypothetical protein